ncbi:hypothetical protein HI914_00046 [Erysiphe necator]|nr:hypothetical protein HI914_00046 [Erysiphe necator]
MYAAFVTPIILLEAQLLCLLERNDSAKSLTTYSTLQASYRLRFKVFGSIIVAATLGADDRASDSWGTSILIRIIYFNRNICWIEYGAILFKSSVNSGEKYSHEPEA